MGRSRLGPLRLRKRDSRGPPAKGSAPLTRRPIRDWMRGLLDASATTRPLAAGGFSKKRDLLPSAQGSRSAPPAWTAHAQRGASSSPPGRLVGEMMVRSMKPSGCSSSVRLHRRPERPARRSSSVCCRASSFLQGSSVFPHQWRVKFSLSSSVLIGGVYSRRWRQHSSQRFQFGTRQLRLD